MNDDEQHLKLLTIFHYVVGGLVALFAFFPIFHLAMGLAMVFAPEKLPGKGGEQPPEWFGWIFIVSASVIMFFGWLFAFLTWFAGRSLSKRKRYTFCLVMGGIECIFFPFGTALGVFTIIVLMRESVKRLFEGRT